MQIQGVNEETVRQMEKHLDQAEGFFAVGSKPKFDVTKARVDLNNARLNLIKAKNAVQVSRVTLNNAMGVPVDFKVELSDMMTFKKEALTLEAAQNLSLRNRPEMISLRLKKESVRHTLENARAQYYPTLSASGSYAYRNEDFPLVHNWNIGATLAFPFFSGFLTSRQVDQAQANMEAAEAQEEIEAQTIRLEVQQAYLDMAAAEEQIAVSGLIVSQAEENLGLAEGRYRAGVGTAIETTDAEVSLSNAKTSAIQALYSHNVARAQLEKAAGGLLPEGTVK